MSRQISKLWQTVTAYTAPCIASFKW